jgi:signal transduction histidine kinase
MNLINFVFLTPFLVSFLLFGFLFFNALKRKEGVGALPFARLTLVLMLWALLSGLESISASFDFFYLWTRIKYTAIVFVPVFWLEFALYYTKNDKKPIHPRNMLFLSLIPTITVILLWTNQFHNFMWRNIRILSDNGYLALRADYGIWFLVYISYSSILFLAGVILIIRKIRKTTNGKNDLIMILSAAIILCVGNLLSFTRPSPYFPNIVQLCAFLISALIMILAIIYCDFLKESPIARAEVFDNIRDPVFILDNDNRIIDLNTAAKIFLKKPLLLSEEKSANEILPFLSNMADLFDDNKGIFNEIIQEINHEKRYFDLRISPLINSERKLYGSMIFLHDITERKLAEMRENIEKEKRHEQEQLLIQQSKLAAMGEMLGAIAHQWRQPLNALGLIVQDLEDAYKFGEIDKNYISESTKKAMSQVNFLSHTIDDFKSFFKLNKEAAEFDIKEVLSEILSLISIQFKNFNILVKVEFRIAEDAGLLFGKRVTDNVFEITDTREFNLIVNGYVNEFKQVILNIVNNARDAIIESREKETTPDKTGYIHFKISRSKNGKNIIIKISDNGGGIPDDIKDRIFEPYFTTKEEGIGIGIGLYMSKMIIEKNMNGKLIAENIEKGAQFIIEL